ncbi:uncharacterized protein LOC115441963 isoform X1 [Manduca sexta]|uniref:uncharacterized protein LOC115441963 isoform X1 n=1 Tax=Manduca sexta TaxID=7130 RepID=UPI00188E1F0E|nr:uncharacterized protein LOC115441963 isoform X1 [Manduca sexta]
MYKTVRHGENSLQYTILPQTEEVLSNSGLKGKGRDYSPSIHVRRTRRKSTVKYVLLIIFGVIFALALASVPLYIMNGALYARRSQQDYHDVITVAPFASPNRDIVKSRKKELKISPEIFSTLISKLETSTMKLSTTPTPLVPSTVLGEKATTPPWTMPALRSWKSSTSSTTTRPIATEESINTPVLVTSNSNNLENDISLKPWDKDIIIRPTVTAEPVTLRNIIKYYSQTFMPSEKSIVINTKMFDDVLIITKSTTSAPPVTTEFTTSSEKFKLKDLKDTMLSVDDDEEFKESLEVDEVFSLPSLKPDPSDISSDSDEVTVSKANDNVWYGARWPFVDTSSYFQWSGYSPGDNLLLPLLVAALSSVALVLLLALAVKRRKRTHGVTAQIGKLTADLQADDNTNLLTAENAEDAEE